MVSDTICVNTNNYIHGLWAAVSPVREDCCYLRRWEEIKYLMKCSTLAQEGGLRDRRGLWNVDWLHIAVWGYRWGGGSCWKVDGSACCVEEQENHVLIRNFVTDHDHLLQEWRPLIACIPGFQKTAQQWGPPLTLESAAHWAGPWFSELPRPKSSQAVPLSSVALCATLFCLSSSCLQLLPANIYLLDLVPSVKKKITWLVI